MTTLIQILKKTEEFFSKKQIPSPRLDAQILLGHVLQMDKMQLYLNHDLPLAKNEVDQIRQLVIRRGNREPIAYIIGSKGFYEHDFIVTSGVLCPRPDTETLVEAALGLLPDDKEFFIADVGCGTGCIGLSIAAAKPFVKVFATDISPIAIQCTKNNAKKLALTTRVAVLSGSLLEPIPSNRSIDLVVSNPPYIPTEDLQTLSPEVAVHEPKLALDGGADGLSFYRNLIPEAARRARLAVLVEVGIKQAEAVQVLMEESGLQRCEIHCDLANIARVVVGYRGEN